MTALDNAPAHILVMWLGVWADEGFDKYWQLTKPTGPKRKVLGRGR